MSVTPHCPASVFKWSWCQRSAGWFPPARVKPTSQLLRGAEGWRRSGVERARGVKLVTGVNMGEWEWEGGS